jgi:D-glycero-D-manno-heptose 1,7-bisphosphate phosphatase
MTHRAVFFDRDGTLNEEVGYVNHLERFNLYPWAAEAVRLVNHAGFKAVVLTNQSGVARQYFTEDLVNQVHQKLKDELHRESAFVDAIYYCPHHPLGSDPKYRVDCQCRKPRPGMIVQSRRELQLDLTRSFVIGDKYLDIELAHHVGATGVLVLTGYGLGEYEHLRHTWQRQPDHVADNVLTAAQWIIRQA